MLWNSFPRVAIHPHHTLTYVQTHISLIQHIRLTLCCFVVYSTRRFVICRSVYHFVLVFFSPFSIAINSLGEERANLSAFHRFVRFVLVWICRFPLPLGVWEGLRFVIVALPGLFSYVFILWSSYNIDFKKRQIFCDDNRWNETQSLIKWSHFAHTLSDINTLVLVGRLPKLKIESGPKCSQSMIYWKQHTVYYCKTSIIHIYCREHRF